MPARYFICPDEQQIEITQCLNNSCRIASDLPGGRCLTARTLRLIADRRTWKGIPSVTQLLKGTRECYLEITKNYALNPQDSIFAVHGTKVHSFLDLYTGMGELGEETMHHDAISGTFDCYDGDTQTLYDTKTWGSYKVQKALGMYQIDVPTGEVYKTNCKSGNKGDPKTRKEWRDDGMKNRLDTAIQLNKYRMSLEALGFPVKTMVIEALVRDGGLLVAGMRGIKSNAAIILINRISDGWIKKYMDAKKDSLLAALEQKTMPPKCRIKERWNNRKCERYCNVKEYCE